MPVRTAKWRVLVAYEDQTVDMAAFDSYPVAWSMVSSVVLLLERGEPGVLGVELVDAFGRVCYSSFESLQRSYAVLPASPGRHAFSESLGRYVPSGAGGNPQ